MTIRRPGLLLGMVALASTAMTLVGHATASLDQALELDEQGVESSGSTPAWVRDTSESKDGEDSAVSPTIGNSAAAHFEISIDGPDTLSFWWKVSSEEDYDFLRLRLDGAVALETSGEVGWTPQTVAVPSGSHVLRWEYAKDEDSLDGQDRAWVDDIRIASKSIPVASYPSFVGAYIGEPIEILPAITGSAESFVLTGTLPAGVQFDPTSGRLHGAPSASGQFDVSVSAQNENGSSAPAPIAIHIDPQPEDVVSSLASGWQWGGAGAWQSQSARSHDGVSALRSGAIGDDESSELSLPVTGPAVVRFWWRVDSEGGHDTLRFLVDGSTATDLSGQPTLIDDLVEWERRIVTIPEGTHLISWVYQKDFALFEGEDAAWLDEIEIIDGRDPDHDGTASLLEVFTGSDWRTANVSPLPLPTPAGDRLTWGIPKGVDAGGMIPSVEISYNMATWSAIPLEVLIDNASQLAVQERQLTPAIAKFVRLSVTVGGE